MAERLLAIGILCGGATYAAAYLVFALRQRAELRAERGSAALLIPLEGCVFFLASLGFPDFVMGTLLGAAAGSALALSLNSTLFFWILVAVMCYTAFTLLRRR